MEIRQIFGAMMFLYPVVHSRVTLTQIFHSRIIYKALNS